MTGFSLVASMIALGLGAGVIGGMFGIGGGLVIVPALILLFQLDQKTATGTSLLAQLLPVAIFAVLEYKSKGQVKIEWGLAIAVGLVFGTIIGAKLTGLMSPTTMKRFYGLFLVAVGIYFLLLGGTVKAKAQPPVKTEVPATVTDPQPAE